MSTWTDLLAAVYEHTKRPDLAANTATAIRTATRMAHRSGRYYRDLTETTLVLTLAEVQEVDLPSFAPNFRQVATLSPRERPDLQFSSVDIADLIDHDKYLKTNVYWGIGNLLRIRAQAPVEQYTLTYLRQPSVASESTYSSWVAEDYQDAVVLPAASIVLRNIGESEIAGRLEQLAAIAMQDVISDNLQIESF